MLQYVKQRPCSDPKDRVENALRYLVPDDPNLPYDMLAVVKKIVDNGTFIYVYKYIYIYVCVCVCVCMHSSVII